MCDFPPVNLDFNEDGCIQGKTVYKIEHYVNATNARFQANENTDLHRFLEKFREENPHLSVEQVSYWGDGDDGTYYHYIDIYFSTKAWYEDIVKRNMRFTYNGNEYLVFYINNKGEMRLMDIKTKKSYFFNPQTLSITKW